MKHYTTIEESKKLLEIGIPVESADMYYCYSMDIKIEEFDYDETPTIIDDVNKADVYDIPCWSLNALLELMPKSINKYDELNRCNKNYSINLFRSYYHCCSYSFGPSLKEENHDNLCCFGEENWIDAVVKTIIWLKEQKYI